MYSGYQTKVVFISDNPDGDNITALSTVMQQIEFNGTTASLIPLLSYRAKKMSGKFIINLSAEETVDIYLEARDRGEIIGEKTRYTIWKRNDFGVTPVNLIFNSNLLTSGKSHDIEIFIGYINNSTLNVNVHSIFSYYV